ncbi:hypothetical protein BH23BAC1_BH23BAC1_35070 [soil metagenome]
MMFSSIKKIQNAHLRIYDFFNYYSHFSSSKIFKPFTFLIFLYAINFYTSHNSFATNYYIALNGRSSGDGSKGNPWDMVTGLSGNHGSPGDTIFVRGGTYRGQFVSELRGTSSRNIVLAQHPGEIAILDGNGGASNTATLSIEGNYATYYGFQVMNSSSKRYTSQSGSFPSDIQFGDGIRVYGSYVKLISLIVKDNLGNGIGFWKSSTNSEIYGCLIYNNGWQGSDRGHGPGIYTQNDNGTKLIRDNIMFGGFGRAIQIYGVNGGLNGFDINGNAIFNTSTLAKGSTASIIIGGESKADNVTIRNNYIYRGFSASGNGVQVHYGNTINGRLTMQNNKFIGGSPALSIKDWEQVSFSGNTVFGSTQIVDFSVHDTYLKNYSWNNNSYHTTNTSNSMDGFTYDYWKKLFGFDGSSKFVTNRPSNDIVLKPHAYVKGSGTIVIVNYAGNSSVDVDLSRILSNGAEYEIRDVENYNASPIITGKYSGGTVRIPMNLTATEKPNGVSSAPHSDSGFGVFVVSTKGKVSATAPVVVNTAPTLNGINDPQAINEDATVQTISLSGISAGGNDKQELKVTATSDNTTLLPHPSVTYTSPNATGTLRYTPAANRWGTANITVKVDDGGSTNNTITRTFKVTVNPINDAPTLNALNNVSVAGNSSTQTINLAGITAGPFENQKLTITATSSITSLIPNPTVTYSSPNATGSLRFTPAANKSGSAVITVTVTDDGSSTAPNVNKFTRTFTINVGALANKQPTLNPINNPTAINEDAPQQTINLTGITAGEGESQTLKVTATSDNTALIPHPSVQYTSPNTSGSIKYTPAANRSGTANITVKVDDGGSANNTITRTFRVTVNEINDAPHLNAIANLSVPGNSPAKTINLSGIHAGPFETQTLTITAASNNTALIPNPSIGYSSPSATGSLTFTPVANKSGSAVITVRVTDNGPGTAPHVNSFTRSFTVTVSAPAVAANKPPTLNSLNNVTINENAPAQNVNISGITSGGENQTLKVTATSDNTSLIPNPGVQYTSPNNSGSIRFTPAANRSGSANITVKVDDGGSANNVITRTFKVTVNGVNKAPQINSISNITVPVNSAARTINLSGITAGPNENQNLKITATSSNTSLIPNPSIGYSSPASTGTLTFTPELNKNGTAVITVRVTDDGPGTAPNVNTFTRNFTITISGGTTAVSSNPPTINSLNDINQVLENSDTRTVNLSGISAGSGNMASLKISATSDQPGIIPNPVVDYKTSSNTGSLKFKPAAYKTGTATITVRVNNGNSKDNITTRTFKVNVVPVNKQPTLNELSDLKIKMNADNQTVNLRGISAGPNEKQNLTIRVRSNNTSLIPTPTVNYSSPNSAGTIRFKPAANQTGLAIITVEVRDNGPGNAPHKNSISRSFAVTVERTTNSEENTDNNAISEVVTLNLMNTVNNTVIFELKDGMTINTKDLPVRLDQLNIDALVNKTTKGSVVFGFNNNSRYTIENHAAFAIAGNTGPNFHKWDGLKPGNHTISATVFSEKYGRGTKSKTYTVNVKIVDDLQGSPFGDIISLHLINAYNDDILFELVEGMTIDVTKLPMALDQLNIRAVSSSTNTGSVIFGFNGNNNYKLENIAPYVIGGNVSNNYYKWAGLKMGKNTVTATTYSSSHGKGTKGDSYTVSFTIVDSKLASKAKTLSDDQIKFDVLKFWPNPVQDQLSIKFFAPDVNDSNAEILINNINGQLVHSMNTEVREGENEVIVDTSDMKGGVYIVTIINNFSKVNLRIIKADN